MPGTHRQPNRPLVSFVMATHNRRAIVEQSLRAIRDCGMDRRDFEIIVVDNASTDGTPDAAAPLADLLLPREDNRGSCAKVFGVHRARAPLIMFVDDDSFPRPGSVERMIRHFESDPGLGAAGFTVHLPDGRLEGGALPGVFLGCGVGLRADALRRVGGPDPTFFMQAEEYDTCFRLAGDGWRVRMFDDLHVEHRKTRHARRSDRTAYLDVRNNLRLVARYLPRPFFDYYRADTVQRYTWLSENDGHEQANRRGIEDSLVRSALERHAWRHLRLGPPVLEHFYRWGEIEERLQALQRSGVRRVLFTDFGKNVYPFVRAARRCEMTVVGIADDRFARSDRRYRGLPLITLREATAQHFEEVIVASTSAVHGGVAQRRASAALSRPVQFWFGSLGSTTSIADREPATESTCALTGPHLP